jgi:hypothetical protein
MAQGLIKKPASAKSKPKPTPHSSSGITKKGSRTIAPKKVKLQKQMKMNRKFTSGLTAQTEKMLGEKAGHLEMIGKGRDKKGAGGADVKGKAKKSKR